MDENIKIQNIGGRRVFYIDVGDTPKKEVRAYLEQAKKEIEEKK